MKKPLIIVFIILFHTQLLAYQENYSDIEIVGEQKFINQVKTSLSLIQDRAPEVFDEIKRYIRRIEQSEKSGMLAYREPPTYRLTKRTAFFSVTWCAGSIAHDARHSKLYYGYKRLFGGDVPDNAWMGKENEKECVKFQISVMEQIGSPRDEIDYLQSLKGGDYAWNDYEKRDW